MCCYHTVRVQKEGAESGNILFFKIDFIAPELPMCSCYKDIFYILIFWWPCVRPLTTSQQDDEIPQDFTGGDLLEVEGLAQGPQKRNLWLPFLPNLPEFHRSADKWIAMRMCGIGESLSSHCNNWEFLSQLCAMGADLTVESTTAESFSVVVPAPQHY